MAPTSLEEPLRPISGSSKGVEWRLVFSHGTNMIGSKAWEFAMPLLLIKLSGGRLVAPAVSGIVTTTAEFLIGPSIGQWTDSVPSRMKVVSVAAAIQSLAIMLTLVVMLFSEVLDSSGTVTGESEDPVWFSGPRPTLGGGLFSTICICGVLEVLGRMASSVSVERDWVPVAFEQDGEVALARVNSRMANIDLIAEMVGPLIAGAFFSITATASDGFVLIAVLDVLSFIPQLWLLAGARRLSPALMGEHKPEEPAGEGDDSPSTKGSWRAFFSHPGGVALLSFSYALVFFTVLSSHDVVLTAFLSQVGLSPWVLSTFRALGAAAGVLGSTSFEWLADRHGARSVAGIFITIQSIAVVVAAGVLASKKSVPGIAPDWLGDTPWYLVPFLISIIVSRTGLYGFDVGFSTISQGLVDERYRGAVGGVTEALCGFFQLCMYAATSFVTAEKGSGGFEYLVHTSAAAVVVAACLFGVWCALYHEHEHTHCVAHGDTSSHGHIHDHGHGSSDGHVHGGHEHTTQQERALIPIGNGMYKHRHVHYHHPLLSFKKA
mmetsp:Transcript_62707/g.132458  ORF Transcript_62707/g.132458 Transcript_62707/m.132458 type:complete len:547 (-) Transcript_62707:533-2173(-)